MPVRGVIGFDPSGGKLNNTVDRRSGPFHTLSEEAAMLSLRWMLGLEFAAWVCCTGGLAAEGSRPNVIVILADDQGYSDLGVQGGKDIPTPYIDSLARNGIRCTNGYVSGPYCSPTRAGLLTGRYQQRYGHEFNPGPNSEQNYDKGLSIREKTLADRLHAAGYKTALVGKWHLGYTSSFHPLNRGFDEFYGFLGGARSYFPEPREPDPIVRGRMPVSDFEYTTDAFGREAVSFIARHAEQPFFLFLSFNAVHTPMHAPQKYLDRFAAVQPTLRRQYCAMTAAMDDAVGQVLAELQRLKLEERTLIFYFSDNGGPPVNGSNNLPLRGQKATTWEGGIRVPFFVQWKGTLPAGKTYDEPVIQLDIVPTVLAAAGIGPVTDTRLDGVNLLPYFQGEQTGPPHDALYWRFGEQRAIRQGRWKLVRANPGLRQELYDLSTDPGETRDLSGVETQKVAELEAAWQKWNQELEAPAWQPPQNAKKARNTAKKKAAAPFE
jgi:arylsulfatase A-like enzyme